MFREMFFFICALLLLAACKGKKTTPIPTPLSLPTNTSSPPTSTPWLTYTPLPTSSSLRRHLSQNSRPGPLHSIPALTWRRVHLISFPRSKNSRGTFTWSQQAPFLDRIQPDGYSASQTG
jgi:hypothetical protein